MQVFSLISILDLRFGLEWLTTRLIAVSIRNNSSIRHISASFVSGHAFLRHGDMSRGDNRTQQRQSHKDFTDSCTQTHDSVELLVFV